ncbi:hypothetical protein PFZ55_47755 [Streptomyces sp. MS2A]|nr:hypothetical protein [Streptomyces sp. MS2A]
MTNSPFPPSPSAADPSVAQGAPRRPGLPWLLILGLSSLALLWPLTGLLGIGDGGPRALSIMGLIAVVWIGVVGFARVRRPVLTLVLVGIGYGVILTFVGLITRGYNGPDVWGTPILLAVDALIGLIAGLLALAIQKMRGRR